MFCLNLKLWLNYYIILKQIFTMIASCDNKEDNTALIVKNKFIDSVGDSPEETIAIADNVDKIYKNIGSLLSIIYIIILQFKQNKVSCNISSRHNNIFMVYY